MAPQWSPSLSVGVEEIDAQHRELFRRAYALVEALKAGRRAEVGGLVEWLGQYAHEHFEAEEALMREVGYPGLAAHRDRHEEFRLQLRALVSEYERKGATPLVTLNLHNWLSDWLRLHVSSADVEIGRFVAGKRQASG
jgi:hemerythrin